MHDPTRTLPPDDDATSTQPPADPHATRSGPGARSSHPAPNLPGYTIESTLGEGGMGVVYKAVQLKLNRTVALKMVHGGRAANPRELLRFIAEVEAVASIEHPNVIRIYESGDVAGQPYFAMEYASGGSLADRLKVRDGETSAALPPREAAALLRKLALAVQAAHERQIVHRDLKPSNVLFDAAGEPKITDFGLAKRTGGNLTSTNAIMGTPAYMAPEQAKGESKFVGPPADVWALGVILYECLTGVKPFSAKNELEILRKVAEEEPSSLRSQVATVPHDLELIAQKCLTKDPASRYPTAAALAEDLRRWQAGEPVSVKAAGSVERLAKWVRRNKLAAGILLASILGTALATTLALVAHRESQRADFAAKTAIDEGLRADRERNEAVAARNLTNEQSIRLAEQVKESRRLLDLSRLRDSQTFFQSNLVGASRESLEAIAPENRCNAWAIQKRLCEGSLFTLYGHEGPAHGVAWSPDGKTLASAGDDGTVRLWAAATGKPVRTLRGSSAMRCVAWSPDGQQIAAGHAAGVVIWNAASGERTRDLTGHTQIVTAVSWSPDGRRLASSSEDRTVRVWSAAGGAPRLLTGNMQAVFDVAWSPDGQIIASAGMDKTVRLWNAANGDPLQVTDCKNDEHKMCLAWRPDGRRLAVGTHMGKLIFIDRADASVVHGQNLGELELLYRLAWSPDGRRIASTSWRGIVRVWMPESNEPPLEYRGHTGDVHGVAWSPDARYFATAADDGTIRIWRANSTRNYAEMEAIEEYAHASAWHPNSRLIASASTEKHVHILDASSGRVVSGLPGAYKPVWQVAWNPEGTRLVSTGKDKKLRIHDPEGPLVRELAGHTGEIECVAWSPRGDLIASGGGDRHVKIWDAATGQCKHTLTLHPTFLRCLAWSPNGTRLVSASNDPLLRVWDVESGECVLSLAGHDDSPVAVAWSPDGLQIASGGYDAVVRVWDAATGRGVFELKGHPRVITGVAWSPDGRRIYSSGNEDAIRVWDAATGQALLAWPCEVRHTAGLAVSPDGRRILAAGFRRISVLEPSTAGSVLEFAGHTANVRAVFRSRDGLQVMSEDVQGQRMVWDAKTGQRLIGAKFPETAPPGEEPDDGFHYLPQGKLIVKIPNWVSEAELIRRLRFLRPDPRWHDRQADLAVKANDWYAAVFHLRRLAALEPEYAEVKARLADAEKKLTHETAPMP